MKREEKGEGETGLKSQNSQRAYVEPIPNLQTEVQLPSSIGRGVMGRTSSKNKENQQKSCILGVMRGCNEPESPTHFHGSYLMYEPNFDFLAKFGGEL